MNELAKELGIELKPFCVRSEEFPSAQICQDMLERCATLGSDRYWSVFETEKPDYYALGYRLLNCHYWGVIYNNRTFTSNDFLAFASNLLSYEEMLDYLLLTEKDGRLVPNEELLKDNNPMYSVDVASGEVQLHNFPDNACVEDPVSSSEPVSMIKGKVVPAELERVLEFVVACSEGDELIWEGDKSMVEAEDWLTLIRNPSHLKCIGVCLQSEYEQITLDKELQEAEEELLKAQAKVDELKKRKK